MKQTAVEWFYEILTTENWEYKTYEEQNEIFQKAKEMEKNQIIQAASVVLWNNSANSTQAAEQYYNETYGNKS